MFTSKTEQRGPKKNKAPKLLIIIFWVSGPYDPLSSDAGVTDLVSM